MDYFLTEEQQEIRNLARQIAEEKVKPVRAELDEKEEFPWEIMKVLAQADLFGLYIPQEYGGFGGGSFENCIAVEELSKACIGVSVSFAASGLGAYPILLFGSEDQKKKYLPQIASGERLAAFGLTESGAGSDAGGAWQLGGFLVNKVEFRRRHGACQNRKRHEIADGLVAGERGRGIITSGSEFNLQVARKANFELPTGVLMRCQVTREPKRVRSPWVLG